MCLFSETGTLSTAQPGLEFRAILPSQSSESRNYRPASMAIEVALSLGAARPLSTSEPGAAHLTPLETV